MAADTPFLGCYVIVKDASKTIDALIASIKGHFDEYVFVDTGSTDGTKEKIATAFGCSEWGNTDFYLGRGSDKDPMQVTFAEYQWHDDFAAARNYCYSLGAAKWRMFLDSDDIVPNAAAIKPALERTDSLFPHVNAISVPYDYAKNETWQDKVTRIVRWGDGWKWEGEIHEDLVRSPPGPRMISKFQRPDGRPEVVVEHRPQDGHANDSIQRNIRICTAIRAKALEAGDARKAAIMSFYLGNYHRCYEQLDKAKEFLLDAGDNLGPTNLACLAYTELAKLELSRARPWDAIEYGAKATSIAPELPDGWGAFGVALVETEQHERATIVFDRLFSLPKAQLQATHDTTWNDGVVWCFAAKAYLALGQLDTCERALKRIPEEIVFHEQIFMNYSRVLSDYYKARGLQYWKMAVDYLVWNNEPVKARRLLESDLVPSNIESSPLISHFDHEIEDKMQQMRSWADYKRVYAAETNEVFDRDEKGVEIIADMGRAKEVMRWAEQLPKEGDPINIYVIGIHGGWIEEFALERNPRIRITACDVNPNANTAITRLMGKFPGRVNFHTVVADHYDWIPPGKEESFDVVFCFEVIEHVPDDAKMLATINKLLKPGGQLLLSTPIAEYWVAPDATKRHHWHQHVRAYQPHQLWGAVRAAGFSGDIYATDNRILFFAQLVKEAHHALAWEQPKISIVIPSTPKGFDPMSAKEGHLGGSEEAVVYLAPELAALGADVTVFVDKKPDRAGTIHVAHSVLWRPLTEFDPKRTEGTVLVWRSPQYAAQLKRTNPKLRVLNWLHDVLYRAHPRDYETADGTIVLSDFHAKAIEKYDGYKGPFLKAPNGINPDDFDTGEIADLIYEGKDPFKCIYASAPNRGLDLLLELWPQIRAREPRATLDIYYGWEITEQMMKRDANLNAEMAPLLSYLREKIKELEPHGVKYHGGVSHEELHRAYARSGVWTYPCHSFEETYCISALKAQAAGCAVVTMKTGALPEVVHDSNGEVLDPNNADDFVSAVVFAMNNRDQEATEEARGWALEHSWQNAAKIFLQHAKKKTQKVVIWAGGGREFDETSLHEPKGPPIGGSEEAVIVLANALTEKGVHVTVYTNCESHIAGNGVSWVPVSERLPDGVPVIVWRYPQIASAIKKQGHKVILWCMDPHYDQGGAVYGEFDAVVTLTKSHEAILKRLDGLSGDTVQIPNGLILSELPPLSIQNEQGRHPEWVMWATSPDRGLYEFLQEWPKVKAAVPKAQLHIFYGIDSMLQFASVNEEYAEAYHVKELCELLEKMKNDPNSGVHYHGGATRSELMAWHVRCGTFAYPVRGFEETQCISIIKAMACGLVPVFNHLGCLDEVTRPFGAAVFNHELFTEVLIDELKNPLPFASRKKMADETRTKYDSNNMADRFIRLIEGI